MKCPACRLGRKWECETRGHCDGGLTNGGSNGLANHNNFDGFLPENDLEETKGNGTYVPGKPEVDLTTYKFDQNLKDQQSTGRKRAAVAYPLYQEEACEWRGKKNVGGNKSITGCINGLQQARHHGPDKNTLNNDEGNVHRICHTCHNRWHTLNDEGYVWGQIFEPHSPIEATPGELLEAQMYWATKTLVKAKD